jgi:drug/metabolite transporter (DMT)-like permease
VADIAAFDVVLWVGVLSAVVMLSLARWRADRSLAALMRSGGWPLVAAGSLQGATAVLFVLAVTATSVANVMVIIAATPLVGAVAAWLVLRERTAARVWMAMAVTAAGIGLVVSGSLGAGSVTGDLYALGAITAFGLSSVVLRRHAGISAPLVVGVGGVVMALVAVAPASTLSHPPATWAALVAMGALAGPLARLMLAVAPRFLPVAEVALFAPMESALAILWAFLAFGEEPSARTWVGGTVILAGVVVGARPGRRHQPDPSSGSSASGMNRDVGECAEGSAVGHGSVM